MVRDYIGFQKNKNLEEVKIAPRRLRQQRDKIHKREERRVCRQKMTVGRG